MTHRQIESSSSSESPDRLRANIPHGGFGQDAHSHRSRDIDNHDRQRQYHGTRSYNEKSPAVEDDDEEEDIDALIEELESENGELEDEEEAGPGMSAKPIPEELLNTDTRRGLTSAEVNERRRRYGLNQMAEEKENLIKKFLMYFVGPIQFVMEVSIFLHCNLKSNFLGCRNSCSRPSRLGRFWRHLCSSAPQRRGRICPRIPSWFHCRRVKENSRP